VLKSKAVIGNHPIHAMLVPIPIGAFFMALVGDALFTASPEDRFWYELSYTCIGIGLLFALPAAFFGAVDYLGVKMSSPAFRLATWHAGINVTVALLYAVSLLLRRHSGATTGSSWTAAMALSVIAFCLLGISGWLGGKLAFVHRVGVIEEPAQPPAGEDRQRAAS
jgi:uncharacterized membrane protein